MLSRIVTKHLSKHVRITAPQFRYFGGSAAAEKPWSEKTILVAGCRGQIGTALTQALIGELGADQVIASDLVAGGELGCRYEQLDVTDKDKYEQLVKENKVDYILHLAAILSSLGEQQPDLAYDVNVDGAANAMNIAREYNCQLFLPSSIAAFGGDHFPKDNTPNDVILQPKTMYGISKVFNEKVGQYYCDKFGVDFRAIRYPGVISSAKYAFNGTTDYSTEIFFHALENNHYECWLPEGQALPMIYVDDCIDATIQFLKVDRKRLTRQVYNLGGISFTPAMLAKEVQELIPGCTVTYKPCPVKSAIASEWPRSIDDSDAQRDWDWSYNPTMKELATTILMNIDEEYKEGRVLNV